MSLFLPVLRLGEEGIASRVQPVVHNNGVLASITPLQPLGWPCSGRPVEGIGPAEGIDKAKSLLLLSIRFTCHESEKMSYADSRFSTIGNQAGESAIFISADSDLRAHTSPNLNKHPLPCGLMSSITRQSGGATISHTGGST